MVEILIFNYVPFIAFVRYILPIKLKLKFDPIHWNTQNVSPNEENCKEILVIYFLCMNAIIEIVRKAKYKYNEYCLIFLN